MIRKESVRYAAAALSILAITLACSLGGTTVDCNVPDLIASINNANANPAPSTLDLAAGCTYTLTAIDNTASSSFGGSTFDYGDNGLPQITTPITINGNNATIVRDAGALPFRIFFITDTGDLTINDLTLQNGFADRPGSAFPSSGGAVYVQGSVFTANNTIFESNQASFHGGAIFSISIGNIYLNGSTVTNNTAPLGGGIHMYHRGLLNIDSSEISENSATNSGGGINAEHGAELVIRDSTISGNTSAVAAAESSKTVMRNACRQPLPAQFSKTTAQTGAAAEFLSGVPPSPSKKANLSKTTPMSLAADWDTRTTAPKPCS